MPCYVPRSSVVRRRQPPRIRSAPLPLPLAVLDLYFKAQDSDRPTPKLAMAGAMLVLTAVTALGVFGTGAIMWRKDFAPFF